MTTETKEPTASPKHIAELLSKAGKAFDRALMEDERFLQCFVPYCLAVLDKLGVRRHALLDIYRDESAVLIPTADQEERLLQNLATAVKEGQPHLYAAYEEDMLSQLRHFSLLWLSQDAKDAESQHLLYNAAKAIPHQLTRQFDNPVRFVTDPVTGKGTLGDIEARTSMRFVFEAQALLKELAPHAPAKKPGRHKGVTKPKKSGRPALDEELAKDVAKAFQNGMDWQKVARKVMNTPIPTEVLPRERLRKQVDRLRYKGESLLKISGR